MSYKLEKRLAGLVPYTPVEGTYAVRLDANESFLTPPVALIELFKKTLDTVEFNRYPDASAKELRDAFGSYYGVNPSFVTAGNGSDEIINLIVETFLKDGDRVLTFSPDFSMYAFYAGVRRAVPVVYARGANYETDIEEALTLAKKENAALVIFSNPCNPTGQLLKKEEVLRLISGLDCLVVVDEAYMDFAEESILNIAEQYPNLIVLRTLSKAGGAAALRLGFAVANEKITTVLNAARSPYNVNSLSQAFGAALYREKTLLTEMRQEIVKMRDLLYNELSARTCVMGKPFRVLPTAANFVYIETEAAAHIQDALKKQGIAVRCFPNRLRIGAGSAADTAALMCALDAL